MGRTINPEDLQQIHSLVSNTEPVVIQEAWALPDYGMVVLEICTVKTIMLGTKAFEMTKEYPVFSKYVRETP